MGLQFIRSMGLTVNGTQIQSLDTDVSAGLRVEFDIKQQTLDTPNVAHITITNLSDATAQAMMKEYGPVVLNAGYVGNTGLIFKGIVNQFIKGRSSPTDTTLQVFAKDSGTKGDAHTFGVVNRALAAGSTPMDHFNAFAQALSQYGVTPGYVPPSFSNLKYPRGVSFFGMVKDHLRTLALSNNCQWFISNGVLNMLPVNGSLPGAPYVLNSQTGLIGMPTQTVNGIMIRCLINPGIKLGGQVQLDQAAVQQLAQSQAYAGYAANSKIPSLAMDGLYTIMRVDVSGDTRGLAWYQDIIGRASNGSGFFPYNNPLFVAYPGPGVVGSN